MSSRKKIRITLAGLAVLTTMTLGLMAPDPRMRTTYNLIVGFFCLSAAVTFTTLVALIPSPPDPRNLLRRRRDDFSDDEPPPPADPPQTFTGYRHPILTRPAPDSSDITTDNRSAEPHR